MMWKTLWLTVVAAAVAVAVFLFLSGETGRVSPGGGKHAHEASSARANEVKSIEKELPTDSVIAQKSGHVMSSAEKKVPVRVRVLDYNGNPVVEGVEVIAITATGHSYLKQESGEWTSSIERGNTRILVRPKRETDYAIGHIDLIVPDGGTSATIVLTKGREIRSKVSNADGIPLEGIGISLRFPIGYGIFSAPISKYSSGTTIPGPCLAPGDWVGSESFSVEGNEVVLEQWTGKSGKFSFSNVPVGIPIRLVVERYDQKCKATVVFDSWISGNEDIEEIRLDTVWEIEKAVSGGTDMKKAVEDAANTAKNLNTKAELDALKKQK